MGLSVALPATGVMDSVEVRTLCVIFYLDIFKNVIIKCRTTAEQDSVQAGRPGRGQVIPRTTNNHKWRRVTMSHRVRISPRR